MVAEPSASFNQEKKISSQYCPDPQAAVREQEHDAVLDDGAAAR